jgi:hypothetical protein
MGPYLPKNPTPEGAARPLASVVDPMSMLQPDQRLNIRGLLTQHLQLRLPNADVCAFGPGPYLAFLFQYVSDGSKQAPERSSIRPRK